MYAFQTPQPLCDAPNVRYREAITTQLHDGAGVPQRGKLASSSARQTRDLCSNILSVSTIQRVPFKAWSELAGVKRQRALVSQNILIADVIEINISNKDTKIFMYKNNKKVNIKTKE